MAEDLIKNSSCFNCRHFLQYYIKGKTAFEAIDYGHCRRRVLTSKDSAGFPFVCGCEFWEEKAEDKR